jgi:hypothetical protein
MEPKDVPVQFGEEVAGRTIVGGRNRSSEPKTMSIHVGIEKVLYLAATNPRFKERLLRAREETVADPALKLDEDEASILRDIPADQMALMIDRIDPDPVKHGGRRFIRAVATCAAALASSAILGGCGGADDTPDASINADVPVFPIGADAAGVSADVPAFPIGDAAGILPDGG